MSYDAETLIPEPERTPAAYQRDLHRARPVIAQLRDEALETGTPFHVGNLALDPAALDELWDGLDRGVTPTSGKRTASAATWSPGRKAPPADAQRPWGRFWGLG